MSAQIKIIIAGIGGVGGYFGGLLAKKYQDDADVRVSFLARGAHLEAIRKHGLKVIKGEETFIAIPYLATSNTQEIGIADYIMICTKTYDLDALLDQLAPCIGPQTVLVPLLNGVEAVQQIKAKLPNNLVTYGCAYIVSTLKTAGVIENMGHRQEIHFGLDHSSDERLPRLEKLLHAAYIDATYSQNILPVVWEKFIFLSCIATATTYFNKTVGELLLEHKDLLINLLDEVTALALKKGIKIDPAISTRAMNHYEALPFEATSSMHRDFISKKPQTELHSLTGYVVREAERFGLATPLFDRAYQQLLQGNPI